jgi:hypothetical protein
MQSAARFQKIPLRRLLTPVSIAFPVGWTPAAVRGGRSGIEARRAGGTGAVPICLSKTSGQKTAGRFRLHCHDFRTTLFEGFEILRHSNLESHRKDNEIAGSGRDYEIWLPE